MKPTLAMIAIFKNEADILEEWIEHHLWFGVSHFYLMNNGSQDDYQVIIEKYKDKITLLHDDRIINTPESWPVDDDAAKYVDNIQLDAYNKLYPLVREDWTAVVDIDEFIYFRRGMTFERMVEHLNKNQVYQVLFPLKLFGSSGFKKQPDSIVDNFVHRVYYDGSNKPQINCKQIVRTDKIRSMGLTACELTEGYTTSAIFRKKDKWFTQNKRFHHFTPELKKKNTGLVPYRRYEPHHKLNELLEKSYIVANHYLNQSKERFWSKKSKRGLPCPVLMYNETHEQFWERRWSMTEKEPLIIDTEIQEARHGKKD